MQPKNVMDLFALRNRVPCLCVLYSACETEVLTWLILQVQSGDLWHLSQFMFAGQNLLWRCFRLDNIEAVAQAEILCFSL